MSHYLVIFLPIEISTLEIILENFQKHFDEWIEDHFSDEEYSIFESKIEEIGAISCQVISNEISLDDFSYNLDQKDLLETFFNNCKSSLVIENLPYLETNAFQVSYLKRLLNLFDDVIVDQGGVSHLAFKKEFMVKLSSFKEISFSKLIKDERNFLANVQAPIGPIDFLVRDVYLEIDKLNGAYPSPDDLGQKVIKIYNVVKSEKLNSQELFIKSGLNAKDFDDGLERLKFWLRKFSN